jgi:stage V sporulation protein B
MTDKARTPDRAVEAGRGALFIGAAKVFFMISGFLQKTLLYRIMGPEGFGAFSVVNGFISIINNATVQGTIQSVSKFTAEDETRVDAVKAAGLKLQLIIGSALALAIVLAAPLVASLYKHPEFTAWFRLAALIPFIYALYSVFVGSANGQRRFRTQAGFDMGFSATKTVLLLAGAAVAGVTGAFAGFVAAALVILVVSAMVMRLPRPGTGPAFPMSKLLAFVAGYTLLINVALNYDLQLLRLFTGRATTPSLANQITGDYEAVRNLALLPYQALLIITFVIFPLVSRSTFEQDREATRAYITQTMRYAAILAGAMAVVLAARPLGLLQLAYGARAGAGATALPILVAGIVCLSLLGVAGSIVNASGHPGVAAALVGATVVVGAGAAFVMVPARPPGPAMLEAAATASAVGMLVGLAAALVYLRRRFLAGPPIATVARVGVSAVAALAVGRLLPGQGKVATMGILMVVGVVFLAVLILLREFGPQDRAKVMKILGRRG